MSAACVPRTDLPFPSLFNRNPPFGTRQACVRTSSIVFPGATDLERPYGSVNEFLETIPDVNHTRSRESDIPSCTGEVVYLPAHGSV